MILKLNKAILHIAGVTVTENYFFQDEFSIFWNVTGPIVNLKKNATYWLIVFHG